MLRYVWRFGTGLHMDGKRRARRNPGTGKYSVLPTYKPYYWNRYSRARKTAWRHGLLWPGLAAIYGSFVAPKDVVFSVLAILPFLCFWLWRKALKIFTQTSRTTNSDGVEEIFRSLRPKYYRKVQKIRTRRFRLAPPDSDMVEPEIGKAIMAENAEDGGSPVISIRRPIGDFAEVLKSEGSPKNNRGRTVRRSVEKRSK
jgi:hypothetical protein